MEVEPAGKVPVDGDVGVLGLEVLNLAFKITALFARGHSDTERDNNAFFVCARR